MNGLELTLQCKEGDVNHTNIENNTRYKLTQYGTVDLCDESLNTAGETCALVG